MRQIEFRGLDSNGVWHYGNLLQSKPFKNGRIDCWIQPKTLLTLGAVSTPTSAFVKVIEKTVGQFIDLTDERDKNIYEGDIAKAITKAKNGCDAVSIWSCEHVDWMLFNGFMFYGLNRRFNVKANISVIINNKVRVIGNIHQNPELLEQ